MQKLVKKLSVVAALLFLGGTLFAAETIQKLGSGAQLIINQTGSSFNDTNEPTSSTVDLAGGRLDKCSFIVRASSAAGTALLTMTIEVSPDGGTTWVSTGNTIALSSGTTAAVVAYSADKPTNPGTKLRLTSSLASSATYWQLKAWAMPSVN